MDCEMCGKPASATATIEGARLHVCASCAKHGTGVHSLATAKPADRGRAARVPSQPEIVEQVRPDTPARLRAQRERRGMPQDAFAKLLGIRLSTYHHYENGSLPDLVTARKIEHVLGEKLVVGVRAGTAPLPLRDEDEAREVTIGDLLKKRK
jgi:uncharacterized protein (TIGR00270 family)